MTIHPGRILFEDEYLLAVAKLSRELVVKGSGTVDKLPLLDFLKQDHPGLRALHRIDFETSGVILFAKTKVVAEAAMASQGEWRKVYRTIVAGRVRRDEGVIDKPLPARTTEELVPAKTTYKVLERFGNSTYLEAQIATGRHHQIRRHFAAIGHPLVLDFVYGDKRYNHTFTQEFRYRDFFLHAASLALVHPVTKAMLTITAPLPKPFEDILKKLRSIQ